MSHDHHDESNWPIIWEVLDASGARLTMLVKYTYLEALTQAEGIFGPHVSIANTGKRKPPGKCCNKCGDKPCGGS